MVRATICRGSFSAVVRLAESGCAVAEFLKHLVYLSLPTTSHPSEVLIPRVLRLAMHRLGRQKQVAEWVNEIEDRRKGAKVLFPNRPVPGQAIAQKSFGRSLAKSSALGLTGHLFAECRRTGHAADHSTHQTFRTPIGRFGRRTRSLFLLLCGRLRTRCRHRESFCFDDFRHVLRIGETVGRGRLRVFVEGLPRRSDQTGILVFSPTRAIQMDARSMPWLTAADAAAIALHDGQLRRLFRTLRQSLVSARGRVSSLRQLATNIMDDALNRVGAGLDAGLSQGNHAALKRARLGRQNADLSYRLGRQFAGVKAQCLPQREKKPCGSRCNRQPARPA